MSKCPLSLTISAICPLEVWGDLIQNPQRLFKGKEVASFPLRLYGGVVDLWNGLILSNCDLINDLSSSVGRQTSPGKGQVVFLTFQALHDYSGLLLGSR